MFKSKKSTIISINHFFVMVLAATLVLSCDDSSGVDVDVDEDPNIPLVIKNIQESQKDYTKENYDEIANDETENSGDFEFVNPLFSATNGDSISLQSIVQFPETLLTASDGLMNDYYGIDVAAGENVTVVGSMVSKNIKGKAYIYHADRGALAETIISGSSGHAGDRFGISVDTDGIWVAVGAPDDNTSGLSAGAVYLFKWNGTQWIEKQKIYAHDPERSNSFGNDVAIHENTLVVGDHTSGRNGAAYVFENDGFKWIQVKKLIAGDGAQSDYFGNSVAIHNNTIVVGAYGDDDNGKNSGSAYVYKKENGNWTLVTKLLPSDGEQGDNFGRSLDIYNDTIIIGAYLNDGIALDSGAVYRFKNVKLDSYTYQWQEAQKITASDGAKSDYFGCSVSISNKIVAVGAHFDDNTIMNEGAVYLFKPFSDSDESLVEINKFIADTPQKLANMGAALDIHNDRIIAGAVGVSNKGINSGGIYVLNNTSSDMEVRNYPNANHTNTELLSAYKDWRFMQQYLNIFDRLETISIKIGGNVTADMQDELTFILRDGCGNEITRRVVPIDTTGLTSPESWKWLDVDLNLDLEYNKYYHFEISTKLSGWNNGTKIVLNTDQFIHGKLLHLAYPNNFPDKKKDIMFTMIGKVDKSKGYYPFSKTNIACPGRCRSVYEEKYDQLARHYFNIVIREDRKYEAGSFWQDYSENHIDDLMDDIVLLLESNEGQSSRGVRHEVPYGEYFQNMNYYIAIVDPDDEDSEGMQCKMYCANSDADVEIVDDYPYGGGAFEGGILRPSMNDENWILGTSSSWGANFILIHELFGHGISRLDDEYTGQGNIAQYPARMSFNNDKLGCPRWCTTSKDIYQVESELSSPCWRSKKETCKADNRCWYIGNEEMPYDVTYYFKDKTCIPKEITRHNIGSDCEGNAGCYIGAPFGADVQLNVAQPSGTLMQSFHGNAADGFTTPVENEIRKQFDCMFPITCNNYDFTVCNKFKEDWEDLFGEFSLACEQVGGIEEYRRR